MIDLLKKFVEYQIEWLTMHDDVEFDPEDEQLIIKFLKDTEKCFMLENKELLQQNHKTGRWVITDDDLVYCSECEDSYYSRPIDASWYYCPNCGARMDGEE